MSVLVVDDDPIVLASCRRILEAEGIPLETASSVAEALQIMARRAFGLLIVDLKMPEQDGLQLLARVRETGVPVPVIVMSGYPTSDTVQSSLESGAYAFVAKPFTPEELLASVQFVAPRERQGG
jgi:DNA-binding NtrC family response regulator